MIEESVQPSSPHCLPPDRHARFFACWFSNLISQENIKAVFSCCAMSAMSRDVDMMLYLALNRHFIVRELGARIFLRMKKVVAEWKMTREVVSSTLLTGGIFLTAATTVVEKYAVGHTYEKYVQILLLSHVQIL